MAARDSQRDVVEFLRSPASYPHRPDRVEHLQTPLSHVFVAEPFAYKLKKAVTLSFVDFGTRELRRSTCEDEVELNRRLCEPLYLGVVPVCRDDRGALSLDGPGDATEHLVWMRALPAEGMLPTALQRGRVAAPIMRRFAEELVRFHALDSQSEPPQVAGTPAYLELNWNDVLSNCAPSVGELVSRRTIALIRHFGTSYVETHRTLFEERLTNDRIREGHGDLHASNLCLIEEPLPALENAPRVEPGLYAFDCLEFSSDMRWLDVASEVAFLAMDLEVRGHAELADTFVGAYLEASGDRGLRRVLPYYEIFRACVRGMVHAQTARNDALSSEVRDTAGAHAQEFFRFAERRIWETRPPMLVAIGGLSGSGKTALAAEVVERTGFVHLSTDEIRKRGAGIDPMARARPEDSRALYGREARERVYREIANEAVRILRSGKSLILDATFHRGWQRRALRRIQDETGVAPSFFECAARPDVIRERLGRRERGSVSATHRARSDADWDVHLSQAAEAEPPGDDEPSITIDTSDRPLAQIADQLLEELAPETQA